MQKIDGRSLSPREVAGLLTRLGISVSPATIRRWGDAGVLRSQVLPSGYRRFDSRDVLMLAAEITQGARHAAAH